MSGPREIPEPGEVVYAPRSSWAPVAFAFAAAVTVCGIFANGFMFPSWVWSALGAIVLIGALRSMSRGAASDYFSRPRKQKVRGAALPVETIPPPQS